MNQPNLSELTIDIRKRISINASVEITFDAMLEQITIGMDTHMDFPMNMRIEPWPGGRYWRDLGNNSGHLWGHVQVIKPPKLLEITGPLFMSVPAINHVQYRVTAEGEGSVLTLVHRGFGLIEPEHRQAEEGWEQIVNDIKKSAEKK